MTREIKFRGKRVDNGEWVYGTMYRISEKLNPFIMLNGRNGFSHEVVAETVGQYTGLKDANDIEIYDGDIIKYTFGMPGSVCSTENGLKVRTGEVFWCEWRSSFAVYSDIKKKISNNDLFRYVRNGNRSEVIGNIHKSKVLSKVKNEIQNH